MASTNIRSVSIGSVLIQSGNGVPTHISTKGSIYVDMDTAAQYINKNGISTWAEVIDSNYALLLNQNQYNAITGATSPSASNVFATIADLMAGSGDTKEVKASSSDTNAGFLNQKLTGSTNISLSIVNSGGNEKLMITQTGLATLSGATFTGPVNATVFYGDGSQLSGISTDNFYTTGTTLVNKTIYFNRNDVLSAYTADLSTLVYQSDFNSHTGNTLNPHNVTATQLGVYTSGQTDNKFVFKSGDTITGSLTIQGNLQVNGQTISAATEHVLISDNLLTLNYLSGRTDISGVTRGTAGIEIDRGALPKYLFEFNESTDDFRVGVTGDTQAVATREDTPLNMGYAYWDALTYKFKTTLDLSANTVSAITFYGDGSQLSGISTDNFYTTGGTYFNGTAIFNRNDGGSYSVSGFYTGTTSLPWSAITSTPTTISGYGITDAYNKIESDSRYVNITGDTMIGDLTISTLTGTTLRAAYLDTNGKIISGDEIGEFYITASTIITALQLSSNWNGTVFTGATDLSSLTSGQKYIDSNYTYEYKDTTMYRNYAGLPSGDTFTAANYYTKTEIDNKILKISTTGITSSIYVDSFGDTLYDGVSWNYVVKSTSGVNKRVGNIVATWDAATNVVEWTEFSSADLGDTSVFFFDVQINTNLVQLMAQPTSGNWVVIVNRITI